jgi:hypothetical protein
MNLVETSLNLGAENGLSADDGTFVRRKGARANRRQTEKRSWAFTSAAVDF